MSLIAAGIMTQTNIGIQGGLFSMLAHGLAAAGLFFAADVILRRTNDASVEASSGIARVNPRFAAYFFIILLSAVGLPLTAGFIGEFYVIWALTGVKLILGLLAALTLIFGAVYMFRLYSKTMFGVPSANVLQFEKLSLSEDYVFMIIVLLILLFGVFPGEWIGIGHYAHEYMKFVPVTK
jgi:NADH-quinone oxidoreductase subunit M